MVHNAEVVTEAIVKAFDSEFHKTNLSNKVIVQTYDSTANTQDHLSGVQQRFCNKYAKSAILIHCNDHVVQLSVKANNKGHKIISRVIDN